MPFSFDDRMWTVAEAMEFLGCSEPTVRRLIARGELKAHRVGRAIRLAPHDVKRVLKPIKVYRPSTEAGDDVA